MNIHLEQKMSYIANCIVAAIMPLMAWLLAVYFNDADPYFMSISGYYILTPSREVFMTLTFSNVYSHFPLLRTLSHESVVSKRISYLEYLVFISVAAISLAPAHEYRIHGLLGVICFTSASAFMLTHYLFRHDKRSTDLVVVVLAAICFIAMPVYFPWAVNWQIMELITHNANPKTIISMLKNHSAWRSFAMFEWTFYYAFLFYYFRLYKRFEPNDNTCSIYEHMTV